MRVLQLLYFSLFIVPSLCNEIVGDIVVSADGESISPLLTLRDNLISLRSDLLDLIERTNANPILIRLAWHDSGTYDAGSILAWPKRGGANGSIRFSPEINHGANNGLSKALDLLRDLKEKYPTISWSDLIQMASALSVEHAGGPHIDMIYGRVDVESGEDCPKEGNLPGAEGPFPDGAPTAEQHLRNVFYRMGFNDQEIVALSGAHTLGRAHKDRSGKGAEKTKFTTPPCLVRRDGKEGFGSTIGGSSWTPNWLTFDNSYYNIIQDDGADSELLKLETDKALFVDESFRIFAERYAHNQSEFFKDYAVAHKKLSELGSKFIVEGGISI